MKSFTKYALLLMIFAYSGVMFGQNSPVTQEQKIALDNANIANETTVVPFSTYANEPTSTNRSLVVESGDGTTYGTYPSYFGDWPNC